MLRLKVIAPMGATLRGPAVLELSPGQAKRRASLLTPEKKGRFALAEGASITFKYGEEFAIGEMSRLNSSLFEDLDAEAKAEAAEKASKGKGKAKADAAADAKAKAEAEANAKAEAAALASSSAFALAAAGAGQDAGGGEGASS